ncbi:MAG TPA: helix-turn-helix transcriptional regulator [Azoarcus taiwanensis]|nr:helix-turn-helix transcriptional regulator [Azoarcus taiwanensis]
MNAARAINKNEVVEEARKLDLADLWGDEDNSHDWWLEGKRDDVAITLTGMLENRGISFADLARKLDWKPSRVSRALSGRENLTINTIAEIIRAADYDFDLLVRPKSAQRALQQWEESELRCDLLEHLKICETLVEAAQAMHETAERLAQRAFRNPMREEIYATLPAQADAANDDRHDELFECVAA